MTPPCRMSEDGDHPATVQKRRLLMSMVGEVGEVGEAMAPGARHLDEDIDMTEQSEELTEDRNHLSDQGLEMYCNLGGGVCDTLT